MRQHSAEERELSKELLQAISDLSIGAASIHSGLNEIEIGVDIEDIARWIELLPRLATAPDNALFTEREHDYCRSNPADADLFIATKYAGRWCAKEAVYKAVSSHLKVDLRQIEILNDERGKPFVSLHVPTSPSAPYSPPLIKLSISHSKNTATAIAVALFAQHSC